MLDGIGAAQDSGLGVGFRSAREQRRAARRSRVRTERPMTSNYYYNYAVVDSKYPGEPQFWGLSGFSFGDAATHGWSFEFAPEATKTTTLVTSNLERQQGRITLAIPASNIPTKEPKWALGTTFGQVLISVESDAGMYRKIGLYKVRVLKVSKEADSYRHRIFKAPMQILLCKVGGGGYVAGTD
jgi:hypothetical protein